MIPFVLSRDSGVFNNIWLSYLRGIGADKGLKRSEMYSRGKPCS